MTMSWEALKKATQMAATTIIEKLPEGLDRPRPTMETIRATWEISSQPRRLPKNLMA